MDRRFTPQWNSPTAPSLHPAIALALILKLAACSAVNEPPVSSPPDDGAPKPVALDTGISSSEQTVPDLGVWAPPDQKVPTCNETHKDRTVGLIKCLPGVSNGYTLLAPAGSKT